MMPVLTCPACGETFRVEGLPASEDVTAARLEERRQVVAYLRERGTDPNIAAVACAVLLATADHVEAGAHEAGS